MAGKSSVASPPSLENIDWGVERGRAAVFLLNHLRAGGLTNSGADAELLEWIGRIALDDLEETLDLVQDRVVALRKNQPKAVA